LIFLNKYHIDDALIDLGGNIYVKGLNNGALWRVGIQDPFKKERTPIGYLI
jgi:thiamine biosynthesis lipoprotein ApbE